jgi:5-methylcytosine-specific restriction endonuclease McrA
MTVLLLDSTYEPLKVISWMKAMRLIVSGGAEIVEESDEQLIRSASKTWRMPSVIRQFNKFKRKKDVQFSRINIYLRDGWTCQYCGKRKQTSELTFDHVTPRAAGGQTTWTNIVAACQPCNHKKANRTPERARMALIKQPIKPRWLPSQIILRLKTIPKKWQPYIDERSISYWTTELEIT